MVHPHGPLREGLHHVRAAAEPLPNRLRPAKGAIHLVLPLVLVDQIVAMTAQEVAPRSVKECYSSAASCARTDKPWLLSSEGARRPAQEHGLLYMFPLSACPAPVTVSEDYSLRFSVPYHRSADGARFSIGPRPAQGEPVPRLQQAFPVEVAHVHAMTLIGRGLLIEPVPVAGALAAHNFLPSFCRNHKASSQHRSGTSLSQCSSHTLRLVGVANLPAHPSKPSWDVATRDVGWLHRFAHHTYQVVAKCLQVCFVAQLQREPFKRLGGVVLLSVEAPVYEGLDTTPQGGEQRCYHQGGDYDG